jgi:hypothetical protein
MTRRITYKKPWDFTDADQSCAQCGERGIQLVPLQQNVCLKYYLFCPSKLFHAFTDRWTRRCRIGFVRSHISLTRLPMLPRYTQTSLVSFTSDRRPCYPQFQQETMASLIRYYKEKSRKALDRLRSELEEKKALKKWTFLWIRLFDKILTNDHSYTEKTKICDIRIVNCNNT